VPADERAGTTNAEKLITPSTCYAGPKKLGTRVEPEMPVARLRLCLTDDDNGLKSGFKPMMTYVQISESDVHPEWQH
jgi:hypothetical protein